ncbi:MAG TPA: homoaconitase [candidate division Zixibacteria bacterium]|nr:homoaconitase [candidate division Zixibacteria bacterium]MDD4917557.1 homoaconitase [candidate division Zixibacteria bacterium]MDM7972174.1 homoaconitase [candidate division Zixibacteria bacterium]HOD66470.1 homoaconitase [candidate division Zixibacteria bacterium]HOZ06756.1 homoaconitase [candidate division Zixibacteria bacterium]
MSHSQTLVEKIAQRYAVGLEPGHAVRAGDYLSIRPAHVMTHDNTGAVIPKFQSIGAARVANPRQPVFTLDHNVQDTTESNLAKYRKIESFAAAHGIDFYPAGRGIGHQIMCEEGYAWPGTMVVASDSHSNMYGGLGCLGTPIVRTDAAAIWATGRTWWQVPPVARCQLKGQLPPGATGKDVIITLCGYFNKDEVLNHAVEFAGDGLRSLSVDERLAIANMTTEWGALVGLFPIDDVTLDWLRRRIEFVRRRGLAGVPSDADGGGEHPRLRTARLEDLQRHIPAADPGAFYARELMLDLATVTPHVSGPNHVKVMTSVADLARQKKRIHKAYLVSCVNSRVEDLAAAAAVVRGKRVAAGVEFYIAAASSEVQAESEKRGDWAALLAAGAIPLPAGCGPCIGLGRGLLGEGEVGISATNRNFKGRMGAREAEAYLASPAVVAASAIAGYITGPAEATARPTTGEMRVNRKPAGVTKAARVIDGFPTRLSGRLAFCRQDNLNTDGIYPGKYTYIDDMTPEQMAAVVMENYDPEFGKLVRKGDILVGGFNFGTGSSREQAATALQHRGIALVVAGSFSETYKRNALNNGFLAIECPDLVNDLKAACDPNRLTAVSDSEATVDFAAASLVFAGKTYEVDPIGAAAQELVLSGGLEGWVRQRL